MKIVGFNFDKINAEKSSGKLEGLKINTKIDISKITKLQSEEFKLKEDLLGVGFTFSVDYSPNIAKIDFTGSLVLAVNSKQAKEILKSWEDKSVPEDFRIVVFNVVLRKANVRALQLEEELNLPLHLPLPALRKQEAQKD